jgi:hypothetical protein
MDSHSDSQHKVHIPFLYYDVIGRMIPGAYLIIGELACFLPFYNWSKLVLFLDRTRALGMSTGLATVVIGTALLFFGLVTVFLGFVLSALSFVLVERVFRRRSPLNHSGLVKFLGIENANSLDVRFRDQFGTEPTKESLTGASFLCAYYIWKTNTNLGYMQGRQDSDLIAAQSFVLVSVALIVTVLCEMIFWDRTTYLGVLLAVLVVIALGSMLAFNYHRKKRVYGRFQLFLALSDPPSPKEAQHPRK